MSNKQIVQSNVDTKNNNSISVCDLLKNNTTKIIRKCETQTPIYTQLYSNYYDEYLHSLEDIFGTCYLSEKHFFDSLRIDDKTLNATDKFWKGVTETTIAHIDMYTNFRKAQFETMTSFMRSYDHFVHSGMDYCAEIFSQFDTKSKFNE
jgi:hypothetical protein